jgi:hypothetical protein
MYPVEKLFGFKTSRKVRNLYSSPPSQSRSQIGGLFLCLLSLSSRFRLLLWLRRSNRVVISSVCRSVACWLWSSMRWSNNSCQCALGNFVNREKKGKGRDTCGGSAVRVRNRNGIFVRWFTLSMCTGVCFTISILINLINFVRCSLVASFCY